MANIENTFIEGMRKDIDKSLMSNKSYLDATNFRLLTTEGSTTGSLENVRGMKSLISGGGDTIRAGQKIIGYCEIRSYVVLFTTSNVTADPASEVGNRSCIYKLELNTDTEAQTALTLLYDDNLNNGGGYLNFSTYYPIKAIGRYETSAIQKVYWTDGYNNVRYANVAEYLTTNGAAYGGPPHFFSVDKFEFQPHFAFSKPSVYASTSGSLAPGVVQYAYQLYKLNGAETVISPLSNTVHITEDSDTLSTTALGYFGTENTGTSAGKGFKIHIDNTANTGFNRVRLYRVHYKTLDATPTVSIVNEMSTLTTGENIYIVDSGNELSQITIDEFNIASTELFSAQDLSVKDNILFAANVEENSFDVTFDTRAIRYRNWDEAVPDSDTTAVRSYTEADATFTSLDDDSIQVVIADFATTCGVPVGRTVTNVTACGTTIVGLDTAVSGVWHDAGDNPTAFSSTGNDTSTSDIVFGGPDLTFHINTLGTDYFGVGFDHIHSCNIVNFWFTYTYTTVTNHTDAYLGDSIVGDSITITVPAGDTPAQWDAAGWSNYVSTHDGQNVFNDPSNDYDESKEYKYQYDGVTLGAEGPYVKVGFATSTITLNNTSSAKYFDSPNGSALSGSYLNMANPFAARSWQRDETYRLYAVFYDEHGQSSFPSWICDLKFPSLKDAGFELTSLAVDTVTGKTIYPTVEFKSLPTGAVSAQVYVVPRAVDDKSILTQCVALPLDVSGATEFPIQISNVLPAANIVKLASPEILIKRDVTSKGTDYLDYVGNYATSVDTDTEAGFFNYYKLRDFDPCTKGSNNETDITASSFLTPAEDDIVIGGFTCHNYNDTDDSYGGSGLFVNYSNASWTPRGATYCIVNYRQDVYVSQYGGNTYEARTKNYCRPCSEVITTTGVAHTCYGGDTFINYFQYLDMISDLREDCAAGGNTVGSIVYVPVESSINCDLRHDRCINDQYNATNKHLMQEVGGEWTDGGTPGITYNQPTDLYLYNTVYSQESNLDYRYCKPSDYTVVTSFDCRVKSSVKKVNGEISDNWTKFGINEYLDVDSGFGAINAIKNVNDTMFYWQDKAFGRLSINERSLITDNNASQLVLGTGGVLDRYDYISDRVGCKDKFSIVRGKAGVYWYDRINNGLQVYGEQVDLLSRSKGIQSYLDTEYSANHRVIAVYDIENEEIIHTFFDSTATKYFSLSYNEMMGFYISRYTYIPNIYITYNDKVLSTTSSVYCDADFDLDRVFIHNSLINNRCYFYGLTNDEHDKYHDSTIKVLFNPEYSNTKVFDNLYFLTNLYNNSNDEVYDVTFDQVRCYNDFQNSDYVSLSMYNNLVRRERTWNMAVPRNVVALDASLYPDIFEPTNFDVNRTYKERLRDHYMIVDFRFINDGNNDKFVFNKVGCTYRTSIR